MRGPGTNPQTGEWVVNFTFNSVGARRFADVTRANVNHRFAIVLDGKVISAPVIREPITGGRGQISGSFTAASANDLAVLLRAGALPAPLTVVEERSVGPELGADSIRAGAISLAVGFVLVIVFMATFYGLFGWFANVCLVVNLVLMLGIMSLLQATLTLPGMAGILLTLGMAVDANILINERIREEQRLGRPPLSALEHGFTRAYNTIFDSNATAFLAHVMLFVFGSGPGAGLCRDDHGRHRHLDVHRLDADAPPGLAVVCRHAPTASAGLIAHVHPSRASAWFPTTPRSRSCAAGSWASWSRRSCRRPRWCCSSIPGLNLGIDFSGGIVMEVRTPGPADFTQIRSALAAEHIPEQGVQQFGDPSEVLIRLGAQPTEAAVQQAVTRVRDRAGEGRAGDQGAAHRCGGRVGLGRTVPQRPAGARHQPGHDPGLHLVPLRVAVRGRRRGDADPGHHQGHRLPRPHADRVRPGDGRGDPDHPRLLHQRQGRGL